MSAVPKLDLATVSTHVVAAAAGRTPSEAAALAIQAPSSYGPPSLVPRPLSHAPLSSALAVTGLKPVEPRRVEGSQAKFALEPRQSETHGHNHVPYQKLAHHLKVSRRNALHDAVQQLRPAAWNA